MLAMQQQNRLLNSTSAVLCPTQHHGVRRVSHRSSSARITAKRCVRQAAATTAADFGTEAAAGQHLVSTVADPKSVMQGTPLKHAKLGNSYDAIVIGSGMGGLAAAVALTKYAGGAWKTCTAGVQQLDPTFFADKHAYVWKQQYIAELHYCASTATMYADPCCCTVLPPGIPSEACADAEAALHC
jgi:hypothetical protein